MRRPRITPAWAMRWSSYVSERLAVQRARTNPESVVELLGIAAEPVDLGHERLEPIGLVPAQVRDADQRRRALGQRRDRGDDRRQLADVVQVELDAVERRAGGEDEVGTVLLDRAAECRDDRPPRVAGLVGVVRASCGCGPGRR